MTAPYIIAEAAQGFEGNPALASLLVRGASAAGADAIKFQIVVADEIAVPDHSYYDLYCRHEMPLEAWAKIRADAKAAGIDLVTDVYGPKGLEIARAIDVDGIKLHSLTFFEDVLTRSVLDTEKPVYVSIGGVTNEEIDTYVRQFQLVERGNVTILFGYQAEPTPIDRNNLARMAALRSLTGLEIGFQDHTEGTGPDTVTLSAVALGLGVRLFEKHITLDRELGMIDNVSALPPAEFGAYVQTLRRLTSAIGDASLNLSEEEIGYRNRAIKRVVARNDLEAGTRISADDILLSRPSAPEGYFRPDAVIGRRVTRGITKCRGIGPEHFGEEGK
jgi:N,N'-diacetyllegionaminate synthase